MKVTPFCLALCAASPLLLAQPTETLQEAYGICAHVSRSEIKYAVPSFQRMTDAGMTWARTDYDWSRVQPAKDQWNFKYLDDLHALARKHNVKILPILGYNTKFAPIAWKDLDAWCAFVRKMAERYQNDLPHWEIWNEQNLQMFWKDRPNGTNYAKLLEATYKTIKSVNPKLTVVYGGTAGVPLPYIEDSLKAGAAEHCDAIAIHPYKWTGIPEYMLTDFEQLKKLLAKYNAADKPIWITEVGWSTALVNNRYNDVFKAAFKHLGIPLGQFPLTIIHDPKYNYGSSTLRNPNVDNNAFNGQHVITFDDIAQLDPKTHPVLMPATHERFPSSAYFGALKTYLAKGGTILFPAGLPLYYDIILNADGTTSQRQVNDLYLKKLHIASETWWTKQGVPEKETYQRPGPLFQGQFKLKLSPTWRFFTDENLQPGDEFIPLVSAGTDTYHSQIAAIYKLRSDGLNGNIVVASFNNNVETVPEEVQARHLPRTYLLAFASGVDKVLWYNLRAGEWDMHEREHCFGIVHKDLSPKPAYFTYQQLTKVCPNGSTRPQMKRNKNRFILSWTRPDGTRTWAIWNARGPETVNFAVKGDITHVCDDLGQPLPAPANGKLDIGTRVIYLEGPQDISCQ